MRMVALFLLLIGVSTSLAAQQATSLSAEESRTYGAMTATQADLAARVAANRRVVEQTREFAGRSFGLGVTFVRQFETHINEAVVSNDRVRVTDERDERLLILAELHHFFLIDEGTCTETDATGCATWGHGPFLALQGAGDDALEGGGFGYMIGWRSRQDESQSFNVGLGLMYDPRVRRLAAGFRDGATLPTGETVVQFTDSSGWGLGLTFSFGF